MSATTDAKRLADELRGEGWRVEIRGNGHWMAFHPSGVGYVTFAATPSDWRWLKNTRAWIRRVERAAAERLKGAA